MIPTYQQTANVISNIAKDMGVRFDPGMKILDFGCGSGQLVKIFHEMGLNAYGVDIKSYWSSDDIKNRNKDYLKIISEDPYRIPFEDNFFDFVCSTSVFEHVMNYETCFNEIHRILKVGGSTMHIFPGPWTLPVEPHIYVPFASMIQTKWWLSLWAILGIRNEFQKGLPWKKVAKINKEYCETGIHYEPRKKVRNMIEKIFGNVYYPKKQYIQHSPGGAGKLGRILPIPGYASLIFSCREQVCFMQKLPQY